jgi:Tfp pilus assembly protein PilF
LVLAASPADATALALRAIVQIAKNDKTGAIAASQDATSADAQNFRAWLALSYAQQAAFQLERALGSARIALSLQPESSLAHSRVAELLLSLGDVRMAEEFARAAVASNPNESGAHSMLGFVHLAAINTKAARTDFASAIERDSFSPLPRLGLGLALIRDGELKNGREQLEIAVGLDPTNSLLRSYVGKAYYEENNNPRNALAFQQFELASQFDPLDPTPHFYGAILKYSESQPAEALAELETSSMLNEGRAVYRSRQLLDLDLAARNASQATVYNELGMHQLGLTSAARSLALDPGSGSAHRFLADIYAATPRHEISRASELLQSQLRQPLGAPALQAQLANDVLFKNAFFGPSVVGTGEFNPLFVRDNTQLQMFGLLGNNDTYGEQLMLSGLHGPVHFSLGQLATETDGYRPNNEDSVRQYTGFVQAQFGASTSAQVELTSIDREHGDLTSAFDPTFFSPDVTNNVDVDSQRVGVRHVIDSKSDVLLSVILRDRHETRDDPDPVFPLLIVDDEEVWKAETQYLRSDEGFDLIMGASYFDGDASTDIINPFFPLEIDSQPRHINAYSYVQFAARPKLPRVQIGLSYDDFSSAVGEQSEVNPKLGLIWNVTESITLRAAGFRVLKRRVGSDQGLEPTQLAGFNQFFDDSNGTVSDSGGLAADFELSESISAGLQVTHRSLDAPFIDFDASVRFESQREDSISGYLYWLPNDRFSITFEPRHQDFDHGAGFDEMRLTELPVSLRWFSPTGLRAGITVTAVEQDGVFDAPGGTVEPGSDSFFLVDAIVAYRLPRRMGTISLEGRNLFNEEFQFQEIDAAILLPRYVPEAQMNLLVSMSF